MLKKTITYKDFNGNARTEDFYFNLTTAELAEWELRENLTGGLVKTLNDVISSNDGRRIMDAFRKIIAKSYGIKSEDGRSFVKSEDISSGFLGSEAYSVLFMSLLQDPNAAATFVSSIVPQDLEQQAQAVASAPRPQPQDHRPKQVSESVVTRPPHESGPGFVVQAPPTTESVNQSIDPYSV